MRMIQLRPGYPLPSLPWRALCQLLRISDDPEVAFSALLKWAEQEPRMQAWLCGLSGLPPAGDATVSIEAVLPRQLERLGLARLEHRILASGIQVFVEGPLLAYGMNREQLARRALLAALWADELAALVHRRGLKAMLASVFAMLGAVTVNQRILAAGGRPGESGPPDFDDLPRRWEWEARGAGQDSLAAGATLAVSWGFSRCLEEILHATRDPADALRWQGMGEVVRLALVFSRLDHERRSGDLPEAIGGIEPAAWFQANALDRRAFEGAANRVRRSWRQVATLRPEQLRPGPVESIAHSA